MNDLVSIDWENLPSTRELHRRLNRVELSADAKAAIAQLSDLTVTVGDKIIDVGRRIVAFVLELIRRFPQLTFCTLVALAMSALIGSIPFLGPPLSALLGPLLIAAGLGIGALAELRSGQLGESIDWLTREIEQLVA
jgi:hypothetical protein